MYSRVRRDLARLGQLDHVHRRRDCYRLRRFLKGAFGRSGNEARQVREAANWSWGSSP